jgi:hypothetical protein
MKSFGTIRLAPRTKQILAYVVALVSLLTVITTAVVPTTVSAQSVQLPAAPAAPIDNANEFKSVGFLSMQGGQNLMGEAGQAVSRGDYSLAVKKLQEARQVFNQLSNFYQQLTGTFSGVDNRISDGFRSKALDAAQMRDESTYQLALAHRAQNQPELSVPLLVQIVQSQNPTRDLGKKAYAQLVELGFADTPFPRN